VAGAGQQLLCRQAAGDVSHAAHDDCQLNNKSSAVSEMGDRLATIDMGQVGAAVPHSNRLATIHKRYRPTDRTTVL